MRCCMMICSCMQFFHTDTLFGHIIHSRSSKFSPTYLGIGRLSKNKSLKKKKKRELLFVTNPISWLCLIRIKRVAAWSWLGHLYTICWSIEFRKELNISICPLRFHCFFNNLFIQMSPKNTICIKKQFHGASRYLAQTFDVCIWQWPIGKKEVSAKEGRCLLEDRQRFSHPWSG